jgi:3',5'-cyclic AMP phosphodiesterase CpdA
VFQTGGDTGNYRDRLQGEVAALMVEDAERSNAKFFYHLGDVVYLYGEDREYPEQFYEVYKDFLYPIVAIPGNHDGARYRGSPDSLSGFMANFCDVQPRMPPSIERVGRHPGRDTMTQPNCYWTLITPFCTIIGLYTNVPSGGDVREPQTSWFINEMRSAPADKQLIVAMHHPVHSIAAGAHAGSQAMEELLTRGCRESGRVPKLVLAGHVHNYQRYTTTFLGKPCTFVVAGAAGHALDALPRHHKPPIDIDHSYPVRLEFATDHDAGFLRITATASSLECAYVAVGVGRPLDGPFTL